MATAVVVGKTSKKYYDSKADRRAWVGAGSPADAEPPHQELAMVVLEITHDDGSVESRTVYEDQLDVYLATAGVGLEEA